MSDVHDPQARKLIERAVEIKAALRTPEQEEYRRQVDERNQRIQAGIKAPASGTFGGKSKP